MNKEESTILQGIFNTKTITSAGGIVLAIMMSYFLYKVTTNHLDHIDNAIQAQTEVQKDTNDILRLNAQAITGNTEVLKIIERKIK